MDGTTSETYNTKLTLRYPDLSASVGTYNGTGITNITSKISVTFSNINIREIVGPINFDKYDLFNLQVISVQGSATTNGEVSDQFCLFKMYGLQWYNQCVENTSIETGCIIAHAFQSLTGTMISTNNQQFYPCTFKKSRKIVDLQIDIVQAIDGSTLITPPSANINVCIMIVITPVDPLETITEHSEGRERSKLILDY